MKESLTPGGTSACYYLLPDFDLSGDCESRIRRHILDGKRVEDLSHGQAGTTGTMNAKNAIASCLVIALGIILALHFALFWMYGGVFIYENNRIILAVETVMSLAILFFGMERLLSAAGITSRRDVRRTASKSGDRLAGTSYAASAAAGTVSTVAPARASLMVHSSPFSANAGASCSSTGTPADVSPFLAHLPGAGTGTEVHTASRT